MLISSQFGWTADGVDWVSWAESRSFGTDCWGRCSRNKRCWLRSSNSPRCSDSISQKSVLSIQERCLHFSSFILNIAATREHRQSACRIDARFPWSKGQKKQQGNHKVTALWPSRTPIYLSLTPTSQLHSFASSQTHPPLVDLVLSSTAQFSHKSPLLARALSPKLSWFYRLYGWAGSYRRAHEHHSEAVRGDGLVNERRWGRVSVAGLGGGYWRVIFGVIGVMQPVLVCVLVFIVLGPCNMFWEL